MERLQKTCNTACTAQMPAFRKPIDLELAKGFEPLTL